MSPFRPVKELLIRNLSNIPGFRTKRHLIIIESDDWGSIRMPSKLTYRNLKKTGIDLNSDDSFRYNKFDSLETASDLSSLFEVLVKFKDSTGRNPVVTPIGIVANPDFDKILESGFNEYFYEPFTDTYKRYRGCEDSYNLWNEGIRKRLFVPQFHGREHLNVKEWMRALRIGNKTTIIAFNNRMWGVSVNNDPEIKIEFQAAFDFMESDDLNYHKEVISNGLKLFFDLFGYSATYFVPPNGPFSKILEPTCTNGGIKYIFGSGLQIEPLGFGKTAKRVHWLGQKSKDGLTYICRNCFFEPSKTGRDWIDYCLADIKIAFSWHKPAIICSHRVNYIGALILNNRTNGLKQLYLLIKNILKFWPDAEFITSAELGDIINNN